MYAYEEIRHIHMEPTTRCNAACPMCARNVRGIVAPGLSLADLRVEDVRAILPESFLAGIGGFDLCGAYGDPALAADVVEIVDYVRGASPACLITLYTNGGVRSAGWWRRLARSLGAHGRVIFAIDGLRETNGIYRRGVDFDKVMDNARTFIEAGGEARWDYLAFRHNERDIDEARRLAAEMGFREFSVKKTDRFLEPFYENSPEYEDSPDLSRFPIYANGTAIVGYLKPPSDPGLVNGTARRFTDVDGHREMVGRLFDTTPISCRVLDTSSVFISARGLVFPCCWTYVQATRATQGGYATDSSEQMLRLVAQAGGFEQIDARRVGLRAVVEGPLFSAIEQSWACESVAEGRLKVCARACGTDFPAYFDQFESPTLRPRSLQAVSAGRDPGAEPAGLVGPLVVVLRRHLRPELHDALPADGDELLSLELESLGLESVELASFIVDLEATFGVRFDEEMLTHRTFQTTRSVIAVLRELIER